MQSRANHIVNNIRITVIPHRGTGAARRVKKGWRTAQSLLNRSRVQLTDSIARIRLHIDNGYSEPDRTHRHSEMDPDETRLLELECIEYRKRFVRLKLLKSLDIAVAFGSRLSFETSNVTKELSYSHSGSCWSCPCACGYDSVASNSSS